MSLTVKEVSTKKEFKQFIYLPEKIHAHQKNWMPPFYADDMRTFDPKRNLSYRYCECIRLVAYENGKPVGRVAGIINHRYNEHADIKSARFGYMEVPDSFEVVKALLDYIETWAKSKGMTKIIGPMGFTEEDAESFMIDGFDETPTLTVIQNFPSIPKYVEQLGYGKEMDYVVYLVNIKEAMSEDYHKLYKWVKRNKDLHLKNFTTKKELWKYIVPIFRLMNDSFIVLFGYSPFEEDEMVEFAKRYMPGVDPRFVKCVVNNEDEVIGFIIGIPNMAKGIIKAKGRLFPFGFIHILKAMKTTKLLNVYLGAVKEEYRSKGVDVLMGYKLFEECRDAGIEYIDSHLEMETNLPMRAEMERVGGKIYKKHRILSKAI